MKLQLWRNATLQLKIQNSTFLIDPMLGKKGSFGVFPWTNDQRKNPLVNLPFTDQEVQEKLYSLDAVFVSHLHPDHWDETAIQLIDKSMPVICPHSIAGKIASHGFANTKEINTQLTFNGINLHLTEGQHGLGEIGEKMGQVNGLVFQHNNHSVYVAGDSIWCKEVKEAIDTYQPKHIILAGGAATFAIGKPVTMTAEGCLKVAAYAPNATIWVTHLDSVSPCREDRNYLNSFIKANGHQEQCKILADGEEVELKM